MRISTAWIYSSGSSALMRQQSELLRTQQQLSAGKRVLSPADDPIAASSALTTEQARAQAEQYQRNQASAGSRLQLAEAGLAQVEDILQQARELAVQAGNGALGARDRASLAQSLRGMSDALLAVANSGDGVGGYLFSGFQEGVQPFSRNAAGVAYQGDQGSRALQVGAQRFLEVSASGADVFEGARSGNGRFTVSAVAGNQGSAAADAGRVLDPTLITGDTYEIVFTATGAGITYDVVDTTTAATLVNDAAYVPGSAISVLGQQVTVTGSPVTGDRFVLAPAPRQSMFRTLDGLASALEAGASGAMAEGEFQTRRLQALAGIDSAMDHALSVRTGVGSRLRELEALGAQAGDEILSRQQELSRLLDLDYAEAISRFARQQQSLEAAQRSYLSVTGLSLFKFF